MTRFNDRLEQDLSHIADRATPSPTAWEAIQTRIAEQADQPEMEIIMLDENRVEKPRAARGWVLSAAAAVVIVVGGAFALTRLGDGESQQVTGTETPVTSETPTTTDDAAANPAVAESPSAPVSVVDDRSLEELLVEAIVANDGPRIEALLDAGLDVNASLKNGSAIDYIVTTGNYELIAVVAAAGFDLDAHPPLGRTALQRAAEFGDLELISALVEHGADLEQGDGTQQNTAVQYAFHGGQVEAARLLISLGADLDFVDTNGRNTADMARRGGYPEAIAFADELGLTPVFYVGP